MTHRMYSAGEGHLFYAYTKTEDSSTIERYWNGFGLLNSSRSSQDITVEINVALESHSQAVAGFFARNTTTGRIYLLHSGKIGGGFEGVGRNAFLAWSRNRLVPTHDKLDRPARLGILLSPVDDDRLIQRIERFVRQVAEFKRSVREHNIDISELSTLGEEIDRYKAEFAGKKKGKRSSIDIDYLCLHGEIVDALQADREARKSDSEIVANTGLVDLYVKTAGALTTAHWPG